MEPGDAIVRILKTPICGTDLHILKGDVPEVAKGRILGHKGVGVANLQRFILRRFGVTK